MGGLVLIPVLCGLRGVWVWYSMGFCWFCGVGLRCVVFGFG